MQPLMRLRAVLAPLCVPGRGWLLPEVAGHPAGAQAEALMAYAFDELAAFQQGQASASEFDGVLAECAAEVTAILARLEIAAEHRKDAAIWHVVHWAAKTVAGMQRSRRECEPVESTPARAAQRRELAADVRPPGRIVVAQPDNALAPPCRFAAPPEWARADRLAA